MPVYGGIASSVQVSNNSTAAAPCTVVLTNMQLPNQDGVSWTISQQNGAQVNYPITLAPGQSTTLNYYVQYSEGDAGENITPVVFNYTVGAGPTTTAGWMQLYTDPCGYVERPDYVHMNISYDGQPAQTATESQPDGNGNPDPFVIGISTSVSGSGESATVSAVVSASNFAFESILCSLAEALAEA